MIRLRSAFFIILIGCIAAYLIGLMNGYLIAGNVISINGTQKWIEDSTAAYYDPLDKRSRDILPFITRPQSGDKFDFRDILTPSSEDVDPYRED